MPRMWFGSRGKNQEQQWEDASLEMSQHGSDDRVAGRPRSLSAPNPGGGPAGARISSCHHSLGNVQGSPGQALFPIDKMRRRSSTKSIASLTSIDECSEADTLENVISQAAPPASATGADDDPFARADLLAQMSAPQAPEVAHRPRFRSWTPGHCNKKVVWERVIGNNSETLAVLPPLKSSSENTKVSDGWTQPLAAPVRRGGARDQGDGRSSPVEVVTGLFV